jgi:hypothetical protein
MYYQIAGYPFDLSVTSDAVPDLASELHAGLKAVFRAFCRTTLPAQPPTQHEVFVFESDLGQLHCRADQPLHHIQVNIASEAADCDFGSLIEHFESRIISHAVRESPTHFWIHGACLCRSDEVILLIADSGTGKTTLSLGLTTRGYRLITDDIIIMDLDTFHYLPLPRSPKVRGDALEQLAQTNFSFDNDARRLEQYVLLADKYWQTSPVAGPPRRIYFLKRRPDQPPGQQPLSLTDGLLGILPHSNLLAIDPDLSLAARFFADTHFFTLHLGNYLDDLDAIAGK